MGSTYQISEVQDAYLITPGLLSFQNTEFGQKHSWAEKGQEISGTNLIITRKECRLLLAEVKGGEMMLEVYKKCILRQNTSIKLKESKVNGTWLFKDQTRYVITDMLLMFS